MKFFCGFDVKASACRKLSLDVDDAAALEVRRAGRVKAAIELCLQRLSWRLRDTCVLSALARDWRSARALPPFFARPIRPAAVRRRQFRRLQVVDSIVQVCRVSESVIFCTCARIVRVMDWWL